MRTPHQVPVGELADALRTLTDTYPTDDPSETGTIPVTVDGQRIEMHPGHLRWLAQLISDEMASCRSAHPDGDGECGHCHGTGRSTLNEDGPDPSAYDGYTSTDGLIHHGLGGIDIEATAEMTTQDASADDADDDEGDAV